MVLFLDSSSSEKYTRKIVYKVRVYPNGKRTLMMVPLLAYMLYNCTFYLFSLVFNVFLLYVALVSLSLFALTFALANFDVNAISQAFSPKTPVRWISILIIFTNQPWLTTARAGW